MVVHVFASYVSLIFAMTALSTTLSANIQALVQRWTRQHIACPPAAMDYVHQVAATNRVALPPDFIQLYSTANGTPALYPNWLDENYCSWLPVEALQTESREWTVVTDEGVIRGKADVTVFVDYMHRSWEYGFIAHENGEGYLIGIIPTADLFKVLTLSLDTFLQWYIADADELYELPPYDFGYGK